MEFQKRNKMKKIILTIIFIVAGAFMSSAQDVITTYNGKKITAYVTNVSYDTISYKKTPDGITCYIAKNAVREIRYENGDIDLFNQNSAPLYAHGKIVPGMRYNSYKKYYDTGEYIPQPGDPYSRFWNGFASLLIPGLGQCFEGEWLRGALIIAGNVTLNSIIAQGKSRDEYGNIQYSDTSYTAGIIAFVYGIWSICDAVKIAKIKNMYYQDLKTMRTDMSLSLEPFVSCTPQSTSSGIAQVPTAGLSLKLNF